MIPVISMIQKTKSDLVVKNLHAGTHDHPILHGVNLALRPGQIIALMGPNASGKSTLANVLMGHPEYQVTDGTIFWKGKNILKLKTHQRARMGLFSSFQNPVEVPGVNLYEFLDTAYSIDKKSSNTRKEFEQRIKQAQQNLKLSSDFLDRGLNVGFSGGEKKRSETLQLQVLQPLLAILDEIDSGLDIDALKLVAEGVKKMSSAGTGFLIITHYQRLLNYLEPDEVHVMIDGRIVMSGGPELVKKLEREGYKWLQATVPL